MTHIWTDEEKAKRDELGVELAACDEAVAQALFARRLASEKLRDYRRRVDHTGYCMAEVNPTSWYRAPYLCDRKAGHGKDGQYCKQHAKKYPEEGS